MTDDALEALHVLQLAEQNYRAAGRVYVSKLPQWPSTGRCECGQLDSVTIITRGLFDEEHDVTIEIDEDEDARLARAEELWPREKWLVYVKDGGDLGYYQWLQPYIDENPDALDGVGFNGYDMSAHADSDRDTPDGDYEYLACGACGRAYQIPLQFNWH